MTKAQNCPVRRVRYRTSKKTVLVSEIRTGKCIGGHPVQKTDQHHFWYEFTAEQVYKNPELFNEHTGEVCFNCHIIYNAISLIFDFSKRHPDRLDRLIASMPIEMQVKLRRLFA